MTPTGPLFWPLEDLVQAYTQRSLSPVEIVREALDRMDVYNDDLGAYVTITAEAAMTQAAEAERAYARGLLAPLLGVPVSIKDLFDVAGVRTTLGSLAHAGDVAKTDSPAVQRLRAAGAIFLGKTNTAEFGQSATTENLLGPPARNPWDPTRTAGGSSGGAAASVSAGLAAAALGSDGGGSIRIPSAFCGLFGLKPGADACPAGGRFHAMSEFACPGPIVRRAADARPFLGALTGRGYPRHAVPKGLRIAWCGTLDERPIDSRLRAITERAVNILVELGPHAVVDSAPPVAGWADVFRVLVLAEEWEQRGHLLQQTAAPLTDYAARALAAGAKVTSRDVQAARVELKELRERVARFFQDVDLIATPATAVTAFKVGQRPREIEGTSTDWLWGAFPFTPQFNVAGLPAASVPVGLLDGLPVGLQMVARSGGESLLLDVCEQLEAEIGFDTTAVARLWPDPRLLRTASDKTPGRAAPDLPLGA